MASLSVRRHNVTKTVVSFDDVEDDYDIVETSMIPTDSPSAIN